MNEKLNGVLIIVAIAYPLVLTMGAWIEVEEREFIVSFPESSAITIAEEVMLNGVSLNEEHFEEYRQIHGGEVRTIILESGIVYHLHEKRDGEMIVYHKEPVRPLVFNDVHSVELLKNGEVLVKMKTGFLLWQFEQWFLTVVVTAIMLWNGRSLWNIRSKIRCLFD